MLINYLKKKKILIFAIVSIFIIIIFCFVNKRESSVSATSKIVTKKESKKEEKKEEVTINNIIVEIKGAVSLPGVYTLEENSRVIDLINIAGGLIEDANTDYINQSMILSDQMVVKIYTNKEIEDSNKVEVVTKYIEKECNCPKVTNDACLNSNNNINDNITSSSGLVNINNCSLDELLTLPGIGESKALAIIEYRKFKPFEKIEDIKNVTGIGASLYEKVKDYIEV